MRTLDLVATRGGVSAETPMLTPAPNSTGTTADIDALGESIASLAAGLHAATYQLLVLLHEFDSRGGWTNGFLSCAQWLHWRAHFDLGASREKVRVARALPALPRISWCMERGQLSYAKVRALTRVATPDNEAALLDVALAATAAQVERFVRAWRRVDRTAEGREDERRHMNRELSVWVDDDGMVVVRGCLTPEAGAVVQRALEAAADRLFREARLSPTGATLTEDVTPAQRRADALGLLAEAALSTDLDRGTAGDRYQVVLHVDAASDDESVAGHMSPSGTDRLTPARVGIDGGVLELDHDAHRVSAETSRRIACDAAVVPIRHDANDDLLDVGRRTRTVPPSIRRALVPATAPAASHGCTSRRCDAHHLEHWADGGATSLDNLVLLCRRHHRAVHEGGFRVAQGKEETDVLAAGWRAGRRGAATGSERGVAAGRHEPPPAWDGTRFDVAWAIDVLWRPASSEADRVSAAGEFGL